MEENTNEEVKQLVDRAADECLRGAHQPKEIVLTLLAPDPASEEVSYMKEKACELAHAITNNQASISGAIGVDMCSCDMNCKFCSFGTEWGLVAEDLKFEKPEIISMVREYVESSVTTITLRYSTCVETLGIEHTDEEIADKILENLSYRPWNLSCMARVNVPGTPFEGMEEISEERMLQILATIRLVSGAALLLPRPLDKASLRATS